MNNVCDKHKEHPAKIYSKCIDCEVDMLQQRIREQEEVLKWFRDKESPETKRADALYKVLEKVRDYLDRDIFSLAYHEIEQTLYGSEDDDRTASN